MTPITDDHIIFQGSTIKEALKKIERNSLGTVFLVNLDEFIGAISDGDIRRALLKDTSLNDSVIQCVNTNAFFVYENFKLNDVLKKINELQIKAVPVLDSKKRLLGVISSFEPKITYSRKSTKVFILAGGFGTRLEPFTKILPKPLIPLGDKPIVEHIMDNFYKYGFENFTLSLFYKSNLVKTFFNENARDYKIDFVQELDPMGTGGSLQLIKEFLNNETILVANCDSIININFEDFYNYHIDHKFDITILGLLKHFKVPYGVIKYEEGFYYGMDEKPEYDHIINTGFYIIESKIIELIKVNEKIDMPDLIDRANSNGMKIGVYMTSAEWFDIGQWEDYRLTVEHFKKLDLQ